MEYRPLGQTDLQVSAMGFGCWEIGGTYGKIDTGQFEQAVQRAIDAGINCFDTAEAYGMLTGTFHAGMQFDENDWRSRAGQMGGLNLFRTLFGPDHFPRNLRALEELKSLAAEYHKTLPQFALRWTLSNPVVSVALVGCRQASEVEENLGALGWVIAEADMAAIDAILGRHGAVTTPPGWLEDD
jgi:aryl-alcohol dehydrogenase-like predicted oxidoreductase